MLTFWTLFSIAAALAVWLAFWSLITFIVQRSSYQKEFLDGRLPESAPDGFYRGAAHLLFDKQTPWLGKSFDAASNSGVNIMTNRGASMLKIFTPFYRRFSFNSDGTANAYYFKTRAEVGQKDKQLTVLQLDYGAPENPFLIRIILDEIVETAPGTFLGKVHLKVFPGFYSTIGFFGLKKP